MDKYIKLRQRFERKEEAQIVLTFEEIKDIAGIEIDHSFLSYKKNLEKYGYTLVQISQKDKFMKFEKMNQGEIVLVDENDKEVGLGEKMDVHKKGILHRAISVLVFNMKGEMLLQQRALNKYHCPGLWSNATCTHPYLNENPVDAAHRRLQEEMGFDCEIEEKFSFHYIAHFDNGLTEHEYDHVFIGNYDGDIKINSEEVNDYKWVDVEELKKNIVQNPDIYTPWFKIILEKYYNLS